MEYIKAIKWTGDNLQEVVDWYNGLGVDWQNVIDNMKSDNTSNEIEVINVHTIDIQTLGPVPVIQILDGNGLLCDEVSVGDYLILDAGREIRRCPKDLFVERPHPDRAR